MLYVAKEVSFRKKTVDVPIVRHYDVHPDRVDEITNTLPNTSPVLNLFFNKNSMFEQGLIAGDKEVIDSQGNDVMMCIMTFIATFFVFDIGFPAEISQFLAFLQQVLLMVPYQNKKSNGFKEMISLFDAEMEKIQEGAKFKRYCV